MSSSALFFSSATPVSGLPVARPASATPQIDSDAPPELDSRVSRVLAEPIAAPARARTVEDEAPMDGPETETDAPKVNWVFYVPEVLHSLESNSAPVVANSAPDDQVAISTRAINARVRPCIDLTVDTDEEVEIHIVTTDSLDRANGATTEEDDEYGCNRGATTEDDGEDLRAQQRRILVERGIGCAQPLDDDEVEPPQWPLEQVVVVFGVEGIFEAIRGRKPRPKVDWYKVARAPQAGSASARFKDRYPVRRGLGKRDHGDMVELLSDNCSDKSEEEEAEEPEGMIDDFDTEEDYADAARMFAREAARKVRKAAAKRAKKEERDA